jgi:hypothetical protein
LSFTSLTCAREYALIISSNGFTSNGFTSLTCTRKYALPIISSNGPANQLKLTLSAHTFPSLSFTHKRSIFRKPERNSNIILAKLLASNVLKISESSSST